MSCPSGTCGVGSNRAGNLATPMGMGGGKMPKGYKSFTTQNYTPEQMNLFQSLFGHLGPNSSLSKLAGGDQSQFAQLEAPALKQFSQFQSDTANRFSGLGTGARRSSGFSNAQNQGAADFAESLQSQRLGLQQNALRDLMGMSSSLLGQRPFEQHIIQPAPKGPSGWQQLLGGLVGGISGGLGNLGSLWGASKLGLF